MASDQSVAEDNTLQINDLSKPLSILIRDRIRDLILQGDLNPGSRLVESHLSKEMAVSRIPVREALRALEYEGLVTIEPRRGAFVSVVSVDLAFQMVEVRAVLEGFNAKLAAQCCDTDTAATLQAMLDKGNAAAQENDLKTCAGMNGEFHNKLGTISGNAVLLDTVARLRQKTALVFAPSNKTRTLQNWLEHANILRAVIDGNSELSEQLANNHVHNAAQAYVEWRNKAN